MDSVLAQSVVVLHDFVSGGQELGEAVTAIAELAASTVGTDMCGVTLYDTDGRARTVAFTKATVREVDEAQYAAGEGPCLEAARQNKIIAIEDTTTEQRWPEFCLAAAEAGVRSSLSIPIVVGDAAIGALNIYRRDAGSPDREAVKTAELLGGQTAVLSAYFDKADMADHMRKAMESRATIEQAKGVIMASSGCSADVAFDILRQQSQSENRKLRDVATEIVARQTRRAGS